MSLDELDKKQSNNDADKQALNKQTVKSYYYVGDKPQGSADNTCTEFDAVKHLSLLRLKYDL